MRWWRKAAARSGRAAEAGCGSIETNLPKRFHRGKKKHRRMQRLHIRAEITWIAL
jgi:hypothetical protein